MIGKFLSFVFYSIGILMVLGFAKVVLMSIL